MLSTKCVYQVAKISHKSECASLKHFPSLQVTVVFSLFQTQVCASEVLAIICKYWHFLVFAIFHFIKGT